MTRHTVNGRSYHIHRWGSGLPLVMLHGFTGSGTDWEPIAQRLSRDYQVIALDILGFGESDKPVDVTCYSMENIGGDLYKLLRELAAVPVHLVGYSMGGRLALYLLWRYPDLFSSATLESTSPGLKTRDERTARAQHDNALADRIEAEGVESFVDFWETLPIWASQARLSDEVRLRLRQARLKNTPIGLANSLRGMGTGVQPALWDQLAGIDLPLQLIAGEDDSKFVTIMGEMQPLFPCAELNIIPQAGHNTHLEQAEIFAQYLIRFLENQRGEAPGTS